MRLLQIVLLLMVFFVPLFFGNSLKPLLRDLSQQLSFEKGESPSENYFALLSRYRKQFLDNSSHIVSHLFRIQNSNFDGAYRVEARELRAAAGLEQQPWIWNASSSALKKRLLEHPWARDVEINWSLYPVAVSVKIEEREMWLVAELSGDSWLISRDGTPLQPLSTVKNSDLIIDSSTLPRLDGIRSGDSASQTAHLEQALRLLRLLQTAGGLPFEVDRFSILEDGGLVVRAVNDRKYPLVVFSAEGFADAQKALHNLRLTLSDLSSKGEQAEKLDVRFAGQIVVTPKTSTGSS